MKKENFSLKLKTVLLEDRLTKTGPEYQQQAIREVILPKSSDPELIEFVTETFVPVEYRNQDRAGTSQDGAEKV